MVVCELIKQRGTLPQGKFPGSVSSTEGPPIDKGGFREDCLLASQKASVLQRELKKERCNRFSFLLFRLWSCSCGGVTRVVAVIRAAFLGSVFGLLDTTFRSAASWGALAAKFDPLVSLRTVGVPQKNTGPGHHAAVGGASCQPAQIDLASKDQFVTGGWNRGSALAHLRLSQAGEVECSGGVLGGSFNDYLKTLPLAELKRLCLDHTEGIDAWQHVNEDARSTLRPEDPDGLEQRWRRKIDKSEVWNSATVADNLEVS